MNPRSLASRIRGVEVSYGLVIKMPAPALVELAGHVGFDFAMLDTEHGIADGHELEHHLRAADAVGLDCIVRVGGHDSVEILRALDAGAAGVVAPHVTNAAAAAAIVSASHYPPVGRRGFAVSTRAGRQGTVALAEHIESALANTLVIAQVEDGEALDDIDEIASTPSLDAIFIGPSDLSISLGQPGNFHHPRVASAIERCAGGVLSAGNAALCVIVSNVEEARAWERRGARIVLFTVSSLLSACLRQIIEDLHAAKTDERALSDA